MKDIIYFVKKIHAYSGRVLYLNLTASALMSLLEGLAIVLLIPMISLTGLIVFNLEGTPLIGIQDVFQSVPAQMALPLVLLLFIFIAIGQNVCNRQLHIRNTKIQFGFLRHLRVQMYEVLLYTKWNFYVKNRKSDVIHLLTSEVSKVSAGTYYFLQFLASFIFTFIQIGLAFWLSPSITVFVLLSGLLLLFLNRKFLRRSLELGKRNYVLGKEYLAGITDQINGIKDIKSNTLESSRLSWYKKITKDIEKEQVDYTVIKSTSQFYYKVASALFTAVFIYLAISLFQAQLAQLMLIIVIFSRLWPSVMNIQSSVEQILTTLPAFKAVNNMQSECKRDKEFSELAATTPLELNDGIECREVYFGYDEKQYALKNINVKIKANQMTAVVGRSGAGKSTLIDIVIGLHKPQKGSVIIDGIIRTDEMLYSMRKAISYVPQEPFLFNASIKDNLQLVLTDANEEEMWEALHFSSAEDFVRKLPDGLDTIIGDRGIKLSGGERQRIVLARAILKKPSILILDEATSSLDTENEANIQAAIERLKGRMTIIVIAHRLSTIRNADQVIVLDEGQVVQNGRFGTLSQEKKSTFQLLLQNQLKATL
ncbi:ABC transporter ATP-binding protein [Alkalihalobacillus pseudalcaliphilus]|uniref:ABC transporter ATP-binding protein n=1 Tax=Alkalihalobacillus pseudalcaliphilus TaxID=79884 RepID=UPI00064D9D93|nr:ABC transporter ATP-binding protein [Alkalihalobacillus pseudalcaliphilus]KMK75022.1 multidrug ABC transporter [Alkalihalobacillus pseudalcaliphilus]